LGRCWKGRKEGKERATDDVPFLYPAKAAAGPCARLARCGGRGFRMRACRDLKRDRIAKMSQIEIIVNSIRDLIDPKDLDTIRHFYFTP
jgi:hypothetical protein